MTRPRRQAVRALGAALALPVALTLSACTGEASDGDGDPSAASASTAPPLETQVRWGRVTGDLPPETRRRLAATVGDVVDGWTQAAYLGGDYPRRDFADAWPGFTPGAAADARHDRALTSNQDIGARIDAVEGTRSVVRLDALAVKGRPVGLTAHVALTFETTGRLERDVHVKGRLYLTPTPEGWQVFAYDLTKGAV